MGISKPSEKPTNNLESETKLELSDDVYKNLDTLISPEGKSYVAELLKPLYNRGSGQNKPYKKYAAQHALDGSIQRLNIHMDNKPDSEKKFELKRDMQQLYDQLSMGVITLAQAMISPQFKNCAYLMLMALLEDDMEEEISNFMDVII
ncbi:MAG: hypothetical protein GXZ11_01440 [Tissierellia bacterium]|nr:hypothetical protein [Tissierellia bacterium]